MLKKLNLFLLVLFCLLNLSSQSKEPFSYKDDLSSKVEEISDRELVKLNDAVREVMVTSFQSGGATLKSYKQFDGNLGEYGSKFLVYNSTNFSHVA